MEYAYAQEDNDDNEDDYDYDDEDDYYDDDAEDDEENSINNINGDSVTYFKYLSENMSECPTEEELETLDVPTGLGLGQLKECGLYSKENIIGLLKEMSLKNTLCNAEYCNSCGFPMYEEMENYLKIFKVGVLRLLQKDFDLSPHDISCMTHFSIEDIEKMGNYEKDIPLYLLRIIPGFFG